MQARPAFAHAQNLQLALIPLQRQQGGARFGLFGLESWDWLRLGMVGLDETTMYHANAINYIIFIIENTNFEFIVADFKCKYILRMFLCISSNDVHDE